MRSGRPKRQLTINEAERAELSGIARSHSMPAALVLRAKIVLACACEASNQAVAARLALCPHTVGKWRNRFVAERLAGLYDEVRAGRPRTVKDEAVATLISKTLTNKPAAATHWSVRSVAEETGLSKSTVHRLFRSSPCSRIAPAASRFPPIPSSLRSCATLSASISTHRTRRSSSASMQKAKSRRSNAPNRCCPSGFGYVEGVTHDYERHSTITLFAALNVLDGSVLAQCKPRHRHQEYLAFLRHIEAQVPQGLDIHLVVDNYATHKHRKVKAWLAQRPRWQVHFTPTYASWLNQVERFFGLITSSAIRRGSFTSVKDLVAKIDAFIKTYNANSKPFVWTATADAILDKLQRLCQRISGTEY
jgi:putative transposase